MLTFQELWSDGTGGAVKSCDGEIGDDTRKVERGDRETREGKGEGQGDYSL